MGGVIERRLINLQFASNRPGQVSPGFSMEEAMSFLQRELDRIREALLSERDGEIYDRLYAAQQALAWSSDPTGFRSPLNSIMGIQEGSVDCSARPRPHRSSDTCFQSGLPQPRPTLYHPEVG